VSVFGVVCVCVGFEVSVCVGCGFAYSLGYECVWQGLGAYRHVCTRRVGRVRWVAVCKLVSESVCEVVADIVVVCFDFA
jgi:hypothetical protein